MLFIFFFSIWMTCRCTFFLCLLLRRPISEQVLLWSICLWVTSAYLEYSDLIIQGWWEKSAMIRLCFYLLPRRCATFFYLFVYVMNWNVTSSCHVDGCCLICLLIHINNKDWYFFLWKNHSVFRTMLSIYLIVSRRVTALQKKWVKTNIFIYLKNHYYPCISDLSIISISLVSFLVSVQVFLYREP